MSAEETRTGAEVRCGVCGARNAASVVWCSLCFASLVESPAPERVAMPEDRGEEQGDAGDGPADGEPDDARVDAMLAELAVREAPVSRLSGVSGALSGPGARVAVMLGGTVLVTGGAFGLMAAAGSLL